MNKYKNLLINIAVFTITTVATKLTTFLLVPLYTYYLTAAEYGISDMTTLVIGIIMPLGTFAIGDAVLRFMIDDKQDSREIASIGVAITCLSCLVVLLLLPLLELPMFGGLGEYRWLFLLSYIVYAFQDLFSRIARGANQLRLITVASTASAFCTAVCAVLFIAFLGRGLDGFYYSYIAGSLLGSLIFLSVGRHYRYLRLVTWTTAERLLRRMLPYALPLIPNNVLWMFNTSVNRLFITSMLGIAASGIFAASYKIPNLLNMLYSIFFQAWTLSSFQEYRKSNVDRFFSIVFTLLNALLTIVGSLIILLSPWLAYWFLQKDFYQGWVYMPILIFALYFNSLSSFYGSAYTMVMKTRLILISTVASALICLAGTWFFIPYIGLYGAAIAMLFSNITLLLIRIICSQQFIHIAIPKWKTSLTLCVLTIQVFTMTLQIPHYIEISSLCFVFIIAIQIIVTFPLGKEIIQYWKIVR